ncbi:MAG: STAS domain-containing protein [Lentisphaerae bacterium]|nr:STAS domain-containing protein [Lentisphaerota bacterium]
MKSEDLQITALDGGYMVTVSGRANFDYAVPLRELAGKLTKDNWLQIDLENCEAMDSTFMGVLTMLALKLRKFGSQVMLIGASEVLLKLLRDLGVAKLFKLAEEKGNTSGNGVSLPTGGRSDMLTTAQTVAEAHRALVGADSANAEKFKQVIEFADQDVERLKKQSE